MRKRYKIGLIIIGALTLIAIVIGVLKFFQKPEEKEKNTTSVVSSISEFGYTLDDRDTKYMKNTFEGLNDILSAEEIDYEAYAKELAKLFIIDFYTLNNKINKYDVGALEYIYTDSKASFRLKAMDTIYKDIIDNTYQDRVQDLPEITKVEVINVESDTYTINEVEYPSYKVEVNFAYKKDLGYDTKGLIYLVKVEQKLEVASFTPINE